jgi:hypothetical protein
MTWRGVRLRKPKDPDVKSIASQMSAVSDNMIVLSQTLRRLVKEQSLIDEASHEKGGRP